MRGVKQKIPNGAVLSSQKRREKYWLVVRDLKFISFMDLWHAWQDMAICLIGNFIYFIVFDGIGGKL